MANLYFVNAFNQFMTLSNHRLSPINVCQAMPTAKHMEQMVIKSVGFNATQANNGVHLVHQANLSRSTKIGLSKWLAFSARQANAGV
ncbi:hypothetical protein B0680_09675 [Moraxella pluranimalium]|uniref:Uncharacterized protein n=1 Tax=Moraxella pluranimalium TaxID=470453 RepID=A0A1T0CIB3_9GAMM|nr:hypothetical protein B0680_09675 [Moraxella pluranimalium]